MYNHWWWDVLSQHWCLLPDPSEVKSNHSDSLETSHLYNTLACSKVGHYLAVVLRVNWSIKIPAALLQLKAALTISNQPVSLSLTSDTSRVLVKRSSILHCSPCGVPPPNGPTHADPAVGTLSSGLSVDCVVKGVLFFTLMSFKQLVITNKKVNDQRNPDEVGSWLLEMLIIYYDVVILSFDKFLEISGYRTDCLTICC